MERCPHLFYGHLSMPGPGSRLIPSRVVEPIAFPRRPRIFFVEEFRSPPGFPVRSESILLDTPFGSFPPAFLPIVIRLLPFPRAGVHSLAGSRWCGRDIPACRMRTHSAEAQRREKRGMRLEGRFRAVA